MSRMKRYRIYPNAVWCDVHATHHARDTNPYNVADEHGRPLAECSRKDWRNLTILAEPDEGF
jgi:hypothetical protein